MDKFKVAVIIPFYRKSISHFELMALQQCEKILSAYSKIAIKPHDLDLPAEAKKQCAFYDVISFDKKYFDGIQGYNSLMLSQLFYNAFLQYEFILIHQLDAFVFKDELSYWCSQGYDYIGAPWLRKKNDLFFKRLINQLLFTMHTSFNIKKHGLPSKKQFDNKVGNGGFSLRRVNKFYKLSASMHSKIATYMSRSEHEFHEDAFWSIEVNRKKKFLNIPNYKTGLKFSIENAPAKAIKINGNQLPFGCHAWENHLGFWQPIFKKIGYEI